MIYQRHLPQSSIDRLCSIHMSQANTEKEPIKKESGSWWNWGRKKISHETTPVPESVSLEPTKDKNIPAETLKEENAVKIDIEVEESANRN